MQGSRLQCRGLRIWQIRWLGAALILQSLIVIIVVHTLTVQLIKLIASARTRSTTSIVDASRATAELRLELLVLFGH